MSPDGQRIAVSSLGNQTPRQVREYDVATGTLRWQTSTQGQTHGLAFADSAPHGWLAYSPDGTKVLAHMMQQPPFAAPMMSDTLLLRADSGQALRPPAQIAADYADLIASEDGRLALLRWRSNPGLRFPDEVQLFAVDGWQAQGPRYAAAAINHAMEWMFTPDASGLLATADFASLWMLDSFTMKERWRIEMPLTDPVRAWRFSPDGRVLALGLMSGDVWLVDAQSGERSSLASAPSSIVRWLEFDPNGSSLAAISEDEQIVVWDVRTRRPRSLPIFGSQQWQGSRIRLSGDQLFHAGSGELRQWQLTPPAPFDNLAMAAAARLRGQRKFWPHSFDLHGRLLATGDADGGVRLWHLPNAPLLPMRAAALPARSLRFDGVRVVSVDGMRVQLVDIERAPQSPILLHPESVQFAELSADGSRLLTVAGRSLRVIDPVDGTLIGALLLPQTPIRVELASAAQRAVVSTGEFREGVFVEQLHVVDLTSGTGRTLAQTLKGPLQQFVLDPFGSLAYVVEQLPEQRQVARVLGLVESPVACALLDPLGNESFGSATFALDGQSVWMHRWGKERVHRLSHWDLQTCREIATVASQQGADGAQLHALANGVLAHRFGSEDLTLISGAKRRDVPALPRGNVLVDFAVSADGKRAAQATRNGVVLIDLQRGERMSALLPAPIAGNDSITKMAFSPQGDRLLARSMRGRWLHWSLPREDADVSQLTRLAALLDPDNRDPRRAAPLQGDIAHTAQIRKTDAREALTVEFPALNDSAIDPRFFPMDLRAVSNAPLNGLWPQTPAMGGDAVTIAPGTVRFDGIDWQIDGAVQLSVGGPAIALHPTQRASSDVPVGGLRARAVHVLLLLHVPLRPAAPARVAARVVLRDTQGRETALDIFSKRDAVNHSQRELALPSARIAWSGAFPASVRSGGAASTDTYSQIYSVSLAVPATMGAISALRLEAPEGPMEAPLFYAVTLEKDDAS